MIALALHITNVDVGAMGWFKYSCVKDKNYNYDNEFIECNDFLTNVGISEQNAIKTNQLYIFPNPTNGVVYWNSEIVITKVEILGVSGRLIAQYQNIAGNKVQLNSFPNGIYFIRFNTESGIFTNKLILKQ